MFKNLKKAQEQCKSAFYNQLFYFLQVLITKLRSANNVETQQYRKASKALLVLIPLLGVTYVLVLAGPEEGQVANVFSYSRAFLLSSQVKLMRRCFQFSKSPHCRNRFTHRINLYIYIRYFVYNFRKKSGWLLDRAVMQQMNKRNRIFIYLLLLFYYNYYV